VQYSLYLGKLIVLLFIKHQGHHKNISHSADLNEIHTIIYIYIHTHTHTHIHTYIILLSSAQAKCWVGDEAPNLGPRV
jgi:hypothetical protein